MKKLQYMLLVAGLWMVGTMCVMAQVPAANIRYVKTDANGGKYTNDGKSWATAKNNIQDAINSLVAAKALPGEVWVGAGTYSPTESTESSGGSTLYMSFKIPAGVTVRGGFPADGKIKKMSGAQIGQDSIDAYITSPDQRPMIDYTEVGAFAYCQTILTGDLSSQTATFEYNNTRNQFNTTFYGNSYHVVTFATNGFHPDGHAKALDTSKGEAAIECMIIEHGNAHFTATGGHPHEAYGGGIYMVKGSHVYNTCVRQCEATRAGGGIYMDGGGIADHVYVSECQALGLGTTYGYGGGICMEDGTYDASDPTKGMYPTVLRRSGVTGSVARNGGGLAIYCNNTAYKNRLAVSAMLVTNNVAQNEGGGVYLYQGGAISQMTITRNKCIGSGIAVNGMVNGRSGGLYVRDFGNIGNSVIWGNECNNHNVQYAGSRSGNEEAKKPIMRCVMLSRADYADWSGVIKYQVNDLSTDNTGDAHLHYPAFKNPTPTAGYISDIYLRSLMPVDDPESQTEPKAKLPAYSWKVAYSSALANAGVQTVDLDTAGVTPAMNESRDIMGEVFSSHPTLGGYTSVTPMVWPWMGEQATTGILHLYVDPDADYTEDANEIGNSWDNAAHNMSDVLNLMQQTVNAMKVAYLAYRATPDDPKTPNPFAGFHDQKMKLQVHVKEGVVTNNGAYSTGHVRNNTLLIPSIPQEIEDKVTIEILGGYASGLTDHDVSVRNPMKYQTIITGDIIDDYNYNVSHLVTMDGAKNVTFDGFQLRNGNASSPKQDNTNLNGAAFTIKKSTNVTIKNCLVAHCSAEIGAAVYADNSTVDFENCIFHNNASTQQIGLAANKPSIIYSGGTSTLTFDHCDVLRNVGYGAWTDATAHQNWTNSIFYGNMNAPVEDTNDNVDKAQEKTGTHYIMATPAFGGTVTGRVTGSYCLFDGKSQASLSTIFAESRFDMSYVFDGGANSDYPRFINPTKNAGVTPSGDITYYGRATSFEPHNTNPMVNAATTKGVAHTSISTSDCWGTDISTVVNRDFGGLPDIGAVENHEGQKAVDGENAYEDGQGYYGRRLYVRDYRDAGGNIDYAAGGDGSSWLHAINGNAYYHEASGKFLGSSRTGTATWKGIKITYQTTYADTESQFVPSSISKPRFYVIESQTAIGKYISVNAKGVFSLVSTKEEATLFLFTGTTSAGTMYEYTSGKFVTFSSGKMTLNAKPYTLNFDVRNGVIRNGSNYMRVADASATAPSVGAASNNKWNFYEATISEKSREEVTYTDVAVKGLNGLQYAVNKSSIWFEQDGVRREVWVGAGVYSKDNETPADADAYNHFPIDHKTTYEPGNPGSTISGAVEDNTDESCFVIRDGVDVYGAFPKVGNPGKDQRQALVSQYVKVLGGYAPALYETILEPKTPLSTTSMNNTRRVLGQPHLYHSKKGTAHFESGAAWDGFTLRNGYLDSRRVTNARSWGGAGATVYKNVTLRNCVVTRCVNYAPNGSAANGEFRGGGVLVSGGSVEQCYIINNEMRGTASATTLTRSDSKGIAYGAGIYLYSGTVYNCVIANNLCHANIADGGGVFIDDIVNFFNNTIVNNKAVFNTRGVGGLCFWSDQKSQVAVYNTISYNNVGYKVKSGPAKGAGGNANVAFQDGGNVDIYNSIVPNISDVTNAQSYMHYHNCQVVDDTYFQDNLFEVTPGDHIDFSETFVDGAPNTINLRLKAGSKGINMGEVNPDINGVIYDLATYTDMDYTERVKDCAIDVGAYEYNDAYTISPDTETESGKAIYYVTPYGRGVASAANPENAACAEKLQKVLDAAGRYKFQHPETKVVVKVACEAGGSVDPSANYHIPTWIADQGMSISEHEGVKDTTYYFPAARDVINNSRYLSSLTIANSSQTVANINSIAAPTNEQQPTNFYQKIGSTPTVQAGESLTFTLTFPNAGQTSQPMVASLWLDTKGKKTFDEMLTKAGTYGANNNNLATFTATIPATALNGTSCLRLRLDPSSETITNADAGQKGVVYDISITIAGGTHSQAFNYYATRSTNPADQDVRIWSILVPHGVEVWGGYTDVYTSNDDNGFFLKEGGSVTDRRNVVVNPTHFDATYTNKLEKTTATTYHIVTFTDRIFDGNGYPYLATDNDLEHDSHYNPELAYENETDYKHMSDNASITDRAVLDGIFLTGGKADAPAGASNTALQNVHQFGGAAVVEPYAHVRNCILEDNSATYGGALALKEKALVSGCLIRNNTADKGAGIYVFEDGTELSESGRVGRYTVHTAQGSAPKMDANMPHIFLSTIVRNNAQQGGGLWFTNEEANVRVNSSVLWRNMANDQENVSGAYSPEKPESDQTSTTEFYPFAYSAVQNLRMSGTNNMMLQPANKNGARFAKNEDIDHMATDETDFTDFGYYGLTGLSALVRTGMSLHEFDSLRAIHHFAAADFMALDRKANDPNAPVRTYVEIGARALLKPFQSKQLMLRLYVAQPEDMDADAAMAMKSMATGATPGSVEEYYSQEGSSFAYPFQSLQDALDYIYLVRSTKEYKSGQSYMQVYGANNLPFEIMIAKGTYYPTRDLAGHYGESLANTFAVPEGVSLYGGFSPNAISANTWYGRYTTKPALPESYDPATNTSAHPYDISEFGDVVTSNQVQVTIDEVTYTIAQLPADSMFRARKQIDINKNSIIEPWEFENQTILSGDATSAVGKGVYHIVTVCPDEQIAGILPDPMYVLSETEKQKYAEGYGPNEMGQYTHFNGITFQGGRAHSYSSELDEMAKYNYYHGGAALLDGNRYNNNYHDSIAWINDSNPEHTSANYVTTATDYKHTGHTNAVGYRDIPVSFASCRFFDNEAGYGGAISTNVEIELYQSSFEANMASYFSDQVHNADKSQTINVTYAGQGGAVFSTYHVTAYNTLFANNEARDLTHTNMTSGTYYSYRNQSGSNELPGTGGAIYSGVKGNLHLFNCDIVRNMANSYPAIFTMNPNYYTSEWDNGTKVESMWFNQIENTVLWGNELNAAAKSNPANASKLFAAQMVVNYGAATRDGSVGSYVAADNNPANQAALDDATHDNDLLNKRYTEMLHFCAYEPGRGITPKNENDFRMCKTNPTHHTIYQYSHIKDTTTVADDDYFPYQNSNIAISSDNDDLEGPAFMRPSMDAGVDGYLEAADWSPARLNNLTDNGNTRLLQNIVEEDGKKVAKFVKQDGVFQGSGAYYISRYYSMYPNYMHNLPIGDEHYMTSQGGNTDQEMYRVSLDPNPTHNQSYIDIGVYEYIHVPLVPETEDEVDILWVSNFEKPENGVPNGRTWLTPTSDLQRAIETLLASRNGHRKEIRLCDGTYSPIYTIDGSLSFYIDTKYLNDAATGGASGSGHETGYGVKSLTIKGGYSREYNGLYDVDLYPAIIKQQTTTTPSPKFDHLIYIKDATQRYHGAYNESTQYGWNVSAHDNKVNTFPIQIDGVTLINDQATDLASGAAIYYACQSSDGHPVSSTTDAYVTTGKDGSGNHTGTPKPNPAKLIISKTTVLGSGAKNHTSGATAVWSCADGGSVLIYNSLFHSNFGSPLFASNALTINNTYALNGGSIYLGATGGQSKMFNSVLWKNNNNGYQLEMDGLSHDTGNTGDYIHNSTTKDIFAHNAYTGGDTEDIDYDDVAGKPVREHNYNVGLVDLNTDVTYGPNFNDPLNVDILKRDFHISPSMRLLNKGNNTLYGDTILANNTGVYDLAWEVTKRYDLASNNRIAAVKIDLGAYEYQYDLNRVLYVDPNKSVSGDGLSWEGALGFGTIQNAIDLAGVAHSNLKKSTYVFVKAASSTNMDLHTGETLTLRDGVQVYGSVMADYGVECPYTTPGGTGTERMFDDEVLEAFVGDVLLYGRFGTISPVEGHTRISGINTNGTAFTIKDGSVTPHRTIIDGFEVMPKDAAAANITAPVIHITPYKSDGLLATGGTKIGLRNIAVHDYKATGCNVAELDNAILYSTLFHHNTVTGDKAVMKVGTYGYLLNATIEGKTIGANNEAQLHGGAVNSNDSAWANTAGEEQSHVYCSLVNFNYPGYRHEPTIKTLSGYCYALEDENLNYQLTENSVNIDNYHSVVPAGIPTLLRDYASAFTPAYTADEATAVMALINAAYAGTGLIGSDSLLVYEGKLRAADRDLLGNFRWQPGFKVNPKCDDCNNNGLTYNIIDRGCFETWKIEQPYSVVYPNYPYPGTCEYIMKDQALMIDPVDIHGDASAAAHIPGFVLLQEGASLYGNGREIEIAYAAIERTVKNGQDLMFSLPWDQNMVYNGITDPDRNAVNGLFVVEYENNALKTVRTDAGPVYTYDPTARADWQYRIAPQDSKCWKEITSPVLPACTGAYTHIAASDAAGVKAGTPNAEMTIRCQGKGMSMHDYIYEELVEPGHKQHTGKAVKLYPHDDITPTNGGGDFTDAKNAGWNFIGYPYLISLYHPYTKAIVTAGDDVNAELNPGVDNHYKDDVLITETYEQFLASSNPYAMDRPQTMWLWYDGTQRPDGTGVDGTGGFYSVNSWLREPSAWHVAGDVEPVLRVTEGFFVQTHTLQDHEDLVFYRPTYHSHYPSSAPERSPYRYYVVDGSEENGGSQPGIVSPEQVDSMMRGYEKLIRNQHVYIVRRDDSGRITEAYDLTGRAVKLTY